MLSTVRPVSDRISVPKVRRPSGSGRLRPFPVIQRSIFASKVQTVRFIRQVTTSLRHFDASMRMSAHAGINLSKIPQNLRSYASEYCSFDLNGRRSKCTCSLDRCKWWLAWPNGSQVLRISRTRRTIGLSGFRSSKPAEEPFPPSGNGRKDFWVFGSGGGFGAFGSF